MASAKLDAIPHVDIDKDGVFKYILIKATMEAEDGKKDKLLVRGYARAQWHGL